MPPLETPTELPTSVVPAALPIPDAVIRVWDLSFAYGAAPVLEGVNLEVGAGEFLGIVGPNAGGKSTLLKLILGLLAPQAGRIRVLGHPPAAASRLIGYVPQYPSFPRDFPITVEQAVLLARIGSRGRQHAGASGLRNPLPGWLAALRPGGYGRADRAAARQALEEVEAADLAQRRIGSLSGGQLQRVLLARALAGEPRILILDEPTANIDQRLEGDIFDLLRRLNARLTILVVSHDIGFISSYVGRVACVNRTLICHRTDAIDGQVIRDLYGESVRMVAHRH
jgi:zinc transport system ATP-binding protein